MDNSKIWHKFLEIIKSQISSSNFRTWFSKTQLKGLDDQKLVIATPHGFILENLNKRYLPLMEQAISQVWGKPVTIELVIDSSLIDKVQSKAEEMDDLFKLPQSVVKNSTINPRYTLDNFVVGPTNNVAYAAALAVVQNLGISYNPLFLYGGTGVGKTHLMLGIGNAVLRNNPELKIIYCSSEKFMNDYVEAIQTHKMIDLRRRYRQVDLLLIDDIQFFSGREGTQEEFFHTFNELQGKNAQMILTSDRPPHEIAKLEDRLKSRFAGGLMVDIQAPDFDTRVAILRAKCEEHGEKIGEEALQLLAASFDTNIRELEGKLIQILQNLKAQNLAYTTDNISQALGNKPKVVAIYDYKKVLSVVCNHFNLSQKDLIGPKRHKELVLPRHLAMFILNEQLSLTVERIGQIFGGRDHTSVMHGRDKVKKLSTMDREVQRALIEINRKLLE